MSYAAKVILHAPPWDDPSLEAFVEACVSDKVQLICVMSPDCERVHDVIDELIVIGGHSGILTTWHTDESFAEVRAFARTLSLDDGSDETPQEVRLSPS